ncbi:hypothetical protein Ancab_032796 [Ancistrocladus abbreviatus]
MRRKSTGRDFEERTSNMISKSPPARSTNGDGGGIFDRVGKSPAKLRYRDVGDGGLSDPDVVSKSPDRSNGSVSRSLMGEDGLDCFKGVSKLPARSRNGNVNDSGLSDSDGVRESPARSINRTVRWSPIRDVVDGYDGVSKSPARSIDEDAWESLERSVSVNTERREKVSSWVDRIGRQEEVGGRLPTRKASFDEWTVSEEINMYQTEFGGSDGSFRRWRESAEEQALTDLESKLRRVKVGASSDQIGTVQNSEYTDKHESPLEVPIADLFHHGLEREQRENGFQSGHVGGFVRSEETIRQWVAEGDGSQVTHGDAKVVREYKRMLKYLDEGPSILHSDSFHGHGELRHTFGNSGGSTSAQNLELERAELLRRYSEINEQLNRAGDVTSGKRIGYTKPDIYIQDEIFVPRREAMYSSYGHKDIRRYPYINHGHGPIPFRVGCNLKDINDVNCPLRSVANDIPMHSDPCLPQIPIMTSHHHARHYSQGSVDEYFPMQSMDFDQDPCYSHGKYFHNPTSSCPYCYVNNRRVHPRAPAAAFGNVRALSGLYDSIYSDPNGYHPQGPSPGLANFSARDLHQLRRSGDCDSITGKFGHHQPRNIVVSDPNKRICHPIAGGAPFILCYNCFQLLEMPRKLRPTIKSHQGLRCGACSVMIELFLENKRAIVPGPPQTQPDAAVSNIGPGEMMISNGSVAVNSMKVQSNDFHANGCTFEPVDAEPELLLEQHRLNSGEVGKRQGLSPSSSFSSKEGSNRDTSVIQINVANPAEMPTKMNLVRPPPGSPLWEHFDYSTAFALSRSAVGNNRTCTEQENKVVEKETFDQNSAAIAAVATEIEIYSDEFPKTNSSQNSGEVSRQEEQAIKRNGSESSFGASESDITDLTDCAHHESGRKTDVYVNGQWIQHHDVIEAEKLAGPISPGNYWYDSQAGFWGVMGKRCLGIIPPFIQEFSFPMPVNCAGGNTAVYVNGRELHARDLDLLAARGFPTTKHKFYIVELSGTVIDKDTGKLVANLRRLAPTVQKAGRGFGMRIPRELSN